MRECPPCADSLLFDRVSLAPGAINSYKENRNQWRRTHLTHNPYFSTNRDWSASGQFILDNTDRDTDLKNVIVRVRDTVPESINPSRAIVNSEVLVRLSRIVVEQPPCKLPALLHLAGR